MTINTDKHTSHIIDTENDIVSFLNKLNQDYEKIDSQNIILDIQTYKSVSVKDIAIFSKLSKKHKKAKKSFVIVTPEIDFNSVSDEMDVVRSIEEAHDIIEMDEIERDLGF